MTSYLLLIGVIITGVCGQLLLKYGMAKYPNFQLRELFLLTREIPVVSGFVCYGASTLMYFKALGNLDLSLAYPTISLGYVLVIIMSKFIFDEQINTTRWLAVSIICIGVVFVGLGA